MDPEVYNTVSIVIPVYNDSQYIPELLDTVLLQLQKSNLKTEIIVVDNGSTDNTLDFLGNYDEIRVLRELENPGSPYSARNRGIEASNGEVIVLLDSTCIPEKSWLENGIEVLKKTNADIVGGNVLFDFEGSLSAGKILDALTNIKMKESIEERGVAKTANLFIKKEVFETVGLFPEGVRSGADVIWTGRATDRGLSLIFAEDAVVYKIARGFFPLLKKQWRVAKGRGSIQKNKKDTGGGIKVLKKIIQLDVNEFRTKHRNAGTNPLVLIKLRLIFVAVIVKLTMILSGLVNRGSSIHNST